MKEKKEGRLRPKKWMAPLAGVLIVFGVWYYVCAAGLFNAYVLPSPQRVFRSFLKMW